MKKKEKPIQEEHTPVKTTILHLLTFLTSAATCIIAGTLTVKIGPTAEYTPTQQGYVVSACWVLLAVSILFRTTATTNLTTWLNNRREDEEKQ